MPPKQSRKDSPEEQRVRAARYLQRLDDARTFTRYAEQALQEALRLSPDAKAFEESSTLRRTAAELRKALQSIKQAGSSRFNPKRFNHNGSGK